MIRLALFISFTLVIFSCNNQGTQNATRVAPTNADLLQMNLKGKVQTMTESSYTADSAGKIDKVDSISTEYSFDQNGYLQKQVSKDLSGVLVSEVTFARNDKGAITEFTTTKKGKLDSRLVTDIGEDGVTYTGGKMIQQANRILITRN